MDSLPEADYSGCSLFFQCKPSFLDDFVAKTGLRLMSADKLAENMETVLRKRYPGAHIRVKTDQHPDDAPYDIHEIGECGRAGGEVQANLSAIMWEALQGQI